MTALILIAAVLSCTPSTFHAAVAAHSAGDEIRMAAGVYTTGSSIRLKAGVTLTGAGLQTVLTATSAFSGAVVESANHYIDNGAQIVQAMTIDGNGALTLDGSNKRECLVIWNTHAPGGAYGVKIVGFGTQSGAEDFPLALSYDPSVSGGIQAGGNIWDCIATAPADVANYRETTCIFFGAAQDPAQVVGGSILRNYVLGMNVTGTNGGPAAWQGIGFANVTGLYIGGNVVTGVTGTCGSAIYNDTGFMKEGIIAGNTITKCFHAVLFWGPGTARELSGIQIVNNDIGCLGYLAKGVYVLKPTGGSVSNVSITANQITTPIGIVADGGATLTARGNMLQCSYLPFWLVTGSSSVNASGNHNGANAPVEP